MVYIKLAVLLNPLSPKMNRLLNTVILQSRINNTLFQHIKQMAVYRTVTSNNLKVEENGILIREYIKKINPQYLQILPKKLITVSTKFINTMYIINPETAKEFTSLILDDLRKNMSFVAECNPGIGVLTKELLKAGVPRIHLYEDNTDFHPKLHALMKEYPNQLDLKHINLMKMSDINYTDKIHSTKKIITAFADVPKTKWEDKTCVQYIAATNDPMFMKQVIISVLFQDCYMYRGRATFYVAISPSMYKVLTAQGNKYIFRNIMFKLFFNHKLLGKISRKAFLPWQKKLDINTRHKIRVWKKHDHDVMYVLKIEPKPDIFQNGLEKKDLLYFWHFVRHNAHRNTSRIIPALEKIIPGCGPRLIQNNFDIFTQFGDLPPEEVLQLYMKFRKWPEFEKSSFLPAVDSLILKMQEPQIKYKNKM